MKVRRFLPVIMLLVAILACNMPTTPTPVTPSAEEGEPPATAEPATEAATEPVEELIPTLPPDVLTGVRGPGFAIYPEVKVSLPAVYEGYDLPVNLDGITNYGQFGFSEAQRVLLSQNGFVVTPADWLEFYQLYEDARYQDTPVFATTDAVFHVYHLIFDKMLRDLEREYFEPDIRALTAACVQSAQTMRNDLAGTELESVAQRVLAYFAVANALLDPSAVAPVEVADLVTAELQMIEGHSGLLPSAIFTVGCPADCDPCNQQPTGECEGQPCMCEDYSQYVPRGHYTRSEQLQRYFRAMMWYGRINMRLDRPEETQMALLVTYILRNTSVNDQPAADVWARVYDPTVFIVGKSDDLSFYEYGALWDAVFGASAPPSAVADQDKLAIFTQAARQLPPPQINSMVVYIWEDEDEVTQGFRFMGQRFVLDAYIFEQLVYREVGTPEEPRMLPMGLDIMAAMGSTEAYDILTTLGETEYANYTEQMAKVRSEIGALQIDSWTQNLYWSWLYAFHPLLTEKGEQYPPFMRTDAWARKDLQTALGSWTELKHDTILYAKQMMAELGGGPPPEPPHGWVEPNPEVYARLLALARMTRSGLESRGLLSENTSANLWRLEDLLEFLLDVSQRELAGETLTTEDYERIKFFGGELEAITLAAADQEGEGRPFFENEEQAALVADVATDPNGQVLEEAIGRINAIYVLVPDGWGGVHIAEGGVFSYYEFAWPMNDRLTDEKWREMLSAGDAPAPPSWTSSFVAK